MFVFQFTFARHNKLEGPVGIIKNNSNSLVYYYFDSGPLTVNVQDPGDLK